MKELNTFQKYFVEEFYDDYREGLLGRREFIRRVAYITGSMAAAASTMSLLGCTQVSNIKAAVFGVYAEMDERINAGKDALEQALKDAGITYQMKVYPGVNHAFHNDTGQRYVEEQATQAWMDTLAWFEQHLLDFRQTAHRYTLGISSVWHNHSVR